jgi:hypothetical protein
MSDVKRFGAVEVTAEQFERLRVAREVLSMAAGCEGEDLLADFAMVFDRGDAWGSVTAELFDVCEHLTARGDADEVPAAWEFRAGAGGCDDPRPDWGRCDAADLVAWGECLQAMREVLVEQEAAY